MNHKLAKLSVMSVLIIIGVISGAITGFLTPFSILYLKDLPHSYGRTNGSLDELALGILTAPLGGLIGGIIPLILKKRVYKFLKLDEGLMASIGSHSSQSVITHSMDKSKNIAKFLIISSLALIGALFGAILGFLTPWGVTLIVYPPTPGNSASGFEQVIAMFTSVITLPVGAIIGGISLPLLACRLSKISLIPKVSVENNSNQGVAPHPTEKAKNLAQPRIKTILALIGALVGSSVGLLVAWVATIIAYPAISGSEGNLLITLIICSITLPLGSIIGWILLPRLTDQLSKLNQPPVTTIETGQSVLAKGD